LNLGNRKEKLQAVNEWYRQHVILTYCHHGFGDRILYAENCI